MGFGAGIILLVIGLVLVTGAVDLPQGIQDVVATNTVGWICVVVGILGLLLPLALQRRSRTRVEEQHYR
jgi:hypothetical protein